MCIVCTRRACKFESEQMATIFSASWLAPPYDRPRCISLSRIVSRMPQSEHLPAVGDSVWLHHCPSVQLPPAALNALTCAVQGPPDIWDGVMWAHLPRKHYLVLYDVLEKTAVSADTAMLVVKRPELRPHADAELVEQHPELTVKVATAQYERATAAAHRQPRATWRTDDAVQALIVAEPHMIPHAAWLKNEWQVSAPHPPPALTCARLPAVPVRGAQRSPELHGDDPRGAAGGRKCRPSQNHRWPDGCRR